MIVTEHYKKLKDGTLLNRTYSDAGFRILQNETGVVYDEAVDVVPYQYTYSETDEFIEATEEATDEDYQTALREMGVDV